MKFSEAKTDDHQIEEAELHCFLCFGCLLFLLDLPCYLFVEELHT